MTRYFHNCYDDGSERFVDLGQWQGDERCLGGANKRFDLYVLRPDPRLVDSIQDEIHLGARYGNEDWEYLSYVGFDPKVGPYHTLDGALAECWARYQELPAP